MRNYRAFIRTLGSALFGVLMFAATAQAQNIFGSIVGTVSDASGAVLPGATVTVSNVATGEKRTVTADAQPVRRNPAFSVTSVNVPSRLFLYKRFVAPGEPSIVVPLSRKMSSQPSLS